MQPKFRVLHVLKHFRPTFTGEGIFTERVSAVMDALRPDVAHDMLATETPDPGPTVPASSTLRNIIYLTRANVTHWRRELRAGLWFLRHVWRYDVVHFHTHTDRYFLSYFLVKLLGRRLVLTATLDDSIPGLLATYRPATRLLAARLFGLFDAFVAISNRLQNENLTVVSADRTHLIPIGITVPENTDCRRAETRASLGIGADDLVIIFVGGICDRKDPLFLVERMAVIRAYRPDVRLLLVGPVLETDHLARIHAVIAANGLERHVIFVGEVLDPYPLFAASDIMGFASHLEGFGTVVIEAMAHRLPVVVRDLPAVNDMFVLQGQTGFRFREAAEYDDAMRALIEDVPLRRRMGEAARRHVAQRYDQILIAQRYLDIYLPNDSSPRVESSPAVRSIAALPAAVSIVDARFRGEVELPADLPPLVITSIDAEEEFDWSQPFSRGAVGISSMGEQYRAHAIFERYGIVPAYLIDYPVASQRDGYAPLLDYLRDGQCEVGTQLHPWVNPPFREDINAVNSYPGNLALDLEYEKLRILTDTIEQNLGLRPRIYRAGRYGVGRRTGDILRQLGYHVDTSVVPQRDFGDEGGPDFFGFPARPYWMDAGRQVLELPVSSDVVGPLSVRSARLARMVFGATAERIGLTGTLARTGLAERIKLTPEGITIDEARKLVRAMRARGTKVFTLSYHSPSLMPGSTPYVRNQADLDRFLGWLDSFYEFFINEIGGQPITYADFYRMALQAAHGEPAPGQEARRPAALALP